MNKRLQSNSFATAAISPIREGDEKSNLRMNSPSSKKKKVAKNSKIENPKSATTADLTNVINSPTVKISSTKNFRKMTFAIDKMGLICPMCCFGKNSQTRKQIDSYFKFKQLIDDQMDILTILKKFNSIDKINYFMSGKKSMNLIENCVNPYNYYANGKIPEESEVHEYERHILARLRKEAYF